MSISFGKLLKQYREYNVLTQNKLREELNKQGYHLKSNGTISKWESDNNRPPPHIVECLEDIFSLARGTLLRPAGYLIEAPAKVSNIEAPQSTIITRRLEEHFDHLTNMVHILLANGLDTITKNDSNKTTFPYTLWSGQSGIAIPHELLSSYLHQNVNQLFLDTNEFDLQNFMSHLEVEYPEIKSKGFLHIVKDNPYELIQTLKILAQRKLFKGTCPVCETLLTHS